MIQGEPRDSGSLWLARAGPVRTQRSGGIDRHRGEPERTPKDKTRELYAGSGKSIRVAGSWKLEAGSWKLEAGSWKLEAGSWKLEARS